MFDKKTDGKHFNTLRTVGTGPLPEGNTVSLNYLPMSSFFKMLKEAKSPQMHVLPCITTPVLLLLPQAIQLVKGENAGDLQRIFASRYSFLELQDTN